MDNSRSRRRQCHYGYTSRGRCKVYGGGNFKLPSSFLHRAAPSLVVKGEGEVVAGWVGAMAAGGGREVSRGWGNTG